MLMMGVEENNKNKVNQVMSFEALSPQVKIYNRYFYLRNAKHQQLQQQYNKEIQELASKSKLTPNSYAILAQKLESDITKTLSEVCGENVNVDFQNFQLIVNKLNGFDLIENDKEKMDLEILHIQMWLLLIRYDIELPDEVEPKFVATLLHIFMCPYNLKPHEVSKLLIDCFENLQQRKQLYIDHYPQPAKQILSIERVVKLWYKIKGKIPNAFKKRQKKQQTEFNFMPKINQKSRIYADKSLNKYLSTQRLSNIKDIIRKDDDNELSSYISQGNQIQYHELLYKRKLEKDLILKTNRERPASVYNPQSNRSLKPEEVKKIVDNLYIKKERREDVDHEKRREEEQIKLCTFKPETTQYKKSKSVIKIKNFNKEIQRLQRGRKQKQKLKQIYQNLGRTKQSAINHKTPPSFIERDTPRLILQINIGDRVEEIRLKGDEDCRIVAKKFIVKHGLESNMQSVLQSIIEEQMQTL